MSPYKAVPSNIPIDEITPALSQLSGKSLYFAKKSMLPEFSKVDSGNDDLLNRILWFAAKGNIPYPSKFAGAEKVRKKTMIKNILLQEKWDTPFQTPPFNEITTDLYFPAVREAIKAAEKEINIIAESEEEPTFENTIEALELTGEILGRVTSVLFNLNSAETSKELQAAASGGISSAYTFFK